MTTKVSHVFENASGPVVIPMTNDYLFKALLQENLRVLKAITCSLLHLSPGSIHKLRVLNPIILGEAVNDKDVILDVKVSFNDGTVLDLEMQVVNLQNWPERSLYYACRNYTKLVKGKTYIDATASIQIGFLDYTLFPEHPSFYSTYQLMDTVSHHIYTDKLSIGVVDLTRIDLASDKDRCYNVDKWARLFKSKTWEDIIMLARQDVSIQDAAATIYQLSEDDRIRQQCEAREDYERIQRGISRQMRSLRSTLAKQQKELSQKDEQLSQKDEQLSQKDEQLSQKDEQLSQKDARIAELEALLAKASES